MYFVCVRCKFLKFDCQFDGQISLHGMDRPDPRGARAVFWLGIYPDGACRPGKWSIGGQRDQRRRVHLPPDPWLRERLTAVGGAGTDHTALRSLGGGNLGGNSSGQHYLVRGSVLVSSVFCHRHE